MMFLFYRLCHIQQFFGKFTILVLHFFQAFLVRGIKVQVHLVHFYVSVILSQKEITICFMVYSWLVTPDLTEWIYRNIF